MSATFPYFEFSGSPREIGYQHGSQAREIVHRHLDMALGKLAAAGIDRAEARRRAGLYIPHIERHTPKFARELEGLAEGAGIEVTDAYILQLRAELQTTDFATAGAGDAASAAREREAKIGRAHV